MVDYQYRDSKIKDVNSLEDYVSNKRVKCSFSACRHGSDKIAERIPAVLTLILV